MFDIGWIEMAVIAVVVIIFISPKDLPGVLRAMGQWVAKARAMARELQESIDDMARETGLDEIKKEIESATDYDIKGEIKKTIDPGGELEHALDPDQPLPKPEPDGETAEKTTGQVEGSEDSAVETPVTEEPSPPATGGAKPAKP